MIDFPTARVPGDADTLEIAGEPVPNTQANRDRSRFGFSRPTRCRRRRRSPTGQVKPLSDDDRRTIVRWIDLGCPIDFDYDRDDPDRRGFGWLCDDKRPVLTLTQPSAGANEKLDRILLGSFDYFTGVDPESLRVVADFPINNIQPGENLWNHFASKSTGVWELKFDEPISQLQQGLLVVSVKDRAGNVTRDRTKLLGRTPSGATVTDGIYVGVDLGGTNIHAAVGNAAGEVIAEANVATNARIKARRRCCNEWRRLPNSWFSKPIAPSPRWVSAVPAWSISIRVTRDFSPTCRRSGADIDVAGSLSEQCGCPVQLLNDVRTATLGELVFGRGRDQANISMAFFSIGTGIGGGLVHQGKLVLGSLGAAGELGHQTMLPAGPRCGCGNRGCLETLASGSAISAAGVRLLRSGLRHSYSSWSVETRILSHRKSWRPRPTKATRRCTKRLTMPRVS